MGKKVFTDESLATFVDETKSYVDNAVSTKANSSHTHSISDITNLQSSLDSKASSSHNHTASNITSGTLSSDRLPTVPISKGGTGSTTASGVLTNLGITATAAELNKLDGVTATTTELNYVDGVTSNIQTQLDGKANTSHNHKVTNITDLTATATELNYMDGVTSNVQNQLNTLDVKKAKRITLNGQCQLTSYRTSVIALCKAPTDAYCGGATNSYSSGQLNFHRSNGLYAPVIAIIGIGSSHGAKNQVRARYLCSSDFAIFKPCTFIYNGVTYGGVEVKTSDAEAYNVIFVGETTFDIFGLDIYDSNQKLVLNKEVYDSISYDNVIIKSGWKDSTYPFITSENIGSQSVTSATKDGSGNIISSTYETKTNASNKLTEAKTYTDTVASGKANTSHTHTIENVTNLQTSLNAKQSTITGGASTITDSNLAVSRALISNSSGKVAVSEVTSTELGYLDGVTSNIQTQLNGKSSTSHTHNYAGSSSVGGVATSANKLATARTISLTGDVSGSTSFDGSGNVSIATTIADDSHNHIISNIDGLQTALDSKLSINGGTVGVLTGSSTITANSTLTGNSTTQTPFSTTTNLYYVNKKLSWNSSSYLQHVILLLPVLTSNNWFGYNYIDGKFLCWKSGGNVYDTVEVSLNCVYNSLRYHLEFFGDHPTWELCVCTYNGIDYYAINCPYHANPYTNVEFVGHIKSDLTGGTSTVALPLDVPYYNENTSTALNEEVYESITNTLTTTYVTSASGTPLYSKQGFAGTFNGTTFSGSGVATVSEVKTYLGI